MSAQDGVWIAGFNMPGYLPESEPAGFATFEEAKAYIIGELDRHGDNAFDVGDSLRDTDPDAARDLFDQADALSAAMEDLNLETRDHGRMGETSPWDTVVGNAAYWIIFDPTQSLEDFEDDEGVTP